MDALIDHLFSKHALAKCGKKHYRNWILGEFLLPKTENKKLKSNLLAIGHYCHLDMLRKFFDWYNGNIHVFFQYKTDA